MGEDLFGCEPAVILQERLRGRVLPHSVLSGQEYGPSVSFLGYSSLASGNPSLAMPWVPLSPSDAVVSGAKLLNIYVKLDEEVFSHCSNVP
jgi:hypothetical protein